MRGEAKGVKVLILHFDFLKLLQKFDQQYSSISHGISFFFTFLLNVLYASFKFQFCESTSMIVQFNLCAV